MAKLVGLIGTGRGRVGNVVLSKGLNGQTISRAYQPQVYNPSTTGQIESRAKMALAGLLSKITPSDVLVGMAGANKVERRGRFVSNICRRATISSEGNALLAPAALVFSEGNSIIVPPFGVNREGSSIIVAPNFDAWPDEVASFIVIGVCSVNRTGDYVEVKTGVITKTTPSTTLTTEATVVNVYTIPVFRAAGATNVDYENAVQNVQATNSYTAINNAVSRGLLNYGASRYENSVAE